VERRSSSAAEADLESGDQADAAAGEGGLIGRLTRRRAESGLSQARVAELMQTSQSAVARLESGRHDAQLSTVIRYAQALGFALDLVEGTASQAGGPSGGPAAGAAQTSPGREPRDSGAAVVTEMPDGLDPDHVLTWRQRKVLQAIRDSVQKRGYPPSLREIGEAVGLTSTSSVNFQLSALQRKGFLQWDAGRARTVEVRLPDPSAARPWPGREKDKAARMSGIYVPPQDTAYVPLVGRVAAGNPILAEEHVEDVVPLPRHLVGEGTLFSLQVVGDSMINAAIADRDLVVVRQQHDADNGDIVAAMIDGETTVKTFKQSDGHTWLIPHNPAYAPILGDEATILGRVVAVVRSV
jgi:repressor LexA